MIEKPSRAIVYVRRSTEKQENSLTDQLRWAIEEAKRRSISLSVEMTHLADAVARRQHQIGDLYIDNGITGADLNRPGFLAFHARACNDDTITHCFFWARDRFARPEQVEEAMTLEKKIRHRGKHVVVAQGTSLGPRAMFDSNLSDDVSLLIEYGTAGQFRPDLARKVLRAMGNNAKSGFGGGGRAPYGFVRALVDVTSGKVVQLLADQHYTRAANRRVVYVPGEDAASRKKLDLVRRIANEYHAEMGGLHTIARRLNEDGHPSPDAGRTRRGYPVSGTWTVSTVKTIIEQPLYSGYLAWGRRAEGTTHRFDKESAGSYYRALAPSDRNAQGKTKRVVHRDREAWAMSTPAVAYVPIVPLEVWEANMVRLKKGSEQGGLRNRPRCVDPNRYPLAVYCGSCGERMRGTRYKNLPSYVCGAYQRSCGQQCHHNWVERDLVVKFALNAIREHIVSMKDKNKLADLIREEFIAQRVVSPPSPDPITDLRERRHRLHRTAMKRLQDREQAVEDLDRELKEASYEQSVAELRIMDRELKAAEKSAVASRVDVDEEVRQAMRQVDSLHDYLGEVGNEGLRELFSSLDARLTIRFEKGRQGCRKNVPVAGELRFGGVEAIGVNGDQAAGGGLGTPRLLLKVGRGDRI